MGRGLAQNRKNKWKKIRERKRKYEEITGISADSVINSDKKNRFVYNGLFADNHILNQCGAREDKIDRKSIRQNDDMEQQMKEA